MHPACSDEGNLRENEKSIVENKVATEQKEVFVMSQVKDFHITFLENGLPYTKLVYNLCTQCTATNKKLKTED